MIDEIKINRILDEIEEAQNESLRRGVILLRGPFQSGKTTILNRYLERHRLSKKEYLLDVNVYLLECLSNDRSLRTSNIAVSAKLKSKTSRLFEQYLEQYLTKHFSERSLLLIDSVELLFNYEINLIQIVYRYCQDGKIAIIGMPVDEQQGFVFDWTFSLSKIIDL